MKTPVQLFRPALQRLGFFSIILASLTTNAVLRAQDSTEITALYGRGVHAFFAGSTTKAEEAFAQCIAAGSTDPRVYYFRGISLLREGRQSEAEEDLHRSNVRGS